MFGTIWKVGLLASMLLIIEISGSADGATSQCPADTGYKVDYVSIPPAVNPIKLFIQWCHDSKTRVENILPSAICMSTVQPNGFPATRMMTLRGYDDTGFKIFTDSRSSKVKDIESNSKVALSTFWFHGLPGKPIAGVRTVRIEGIATTLTRMDYEEYQDKLATDPNNQLYIVNSVVQQQTACIGGTRKEELLRLTQEKLTKAQCNPGEKIPYAPDWIGYLIRPETIEFMETAANSITDRLKYVRPAYLGKNGSPCTEKMSGFDDWTYEHLEA